MVEMSCGVRESSLLVLPAPRTPWIVSCDTHRSTTRIPTADLRTLSHRLAHNGTFMVTNRSGSTASLTFNGTSVWLYGSKGKNNGEYNVTLDDDSVFVGNGSSNKDLFHQVLFKATGLDGSKLHRLTVGNLGVNETKHLVIDSVSSAYPIFSHWGIWRWLIDRQIVHEVEVPDDYQEFREQDMSSSFEYSPSAWSIALGGYDGKTGQ